MAAKNIIRKAQNKKQSEEKFVYINGLEPIRFVVPQKLLVEHIRGRWKTSIWLPGVTFQVCRTLKKVVVEAWSGDTIIWSHKYVRLIGNNRIPLPIEKFDWNKVDFTGPILLKIKS